jgi:hypothetical protein
MTPATSRSVKTPPTMPNRNSKTKPPSKPRHKRVALLAGTAARFSATFAVLAQNLILDPLRFVAREACGLHKTVRDLKVAPLKLPDLPAVAAEPSHLHPAIAVELEGDWTV